MLLYLLIGLYVIVAVILVAVVLLQSGKGADLAGAFGGGGSQTAFGARGTATFLSKLTTIAAILFMLLALTLSIIFNKRQGGSIMSDAPKQQTAPGSTPAQQPAAGAPQQQQQQGQPTQAPPPSQQPPGK